MGMLGPCLGQAERDRAGSQVQLGAHLLASGCISAYGLPPSANPQLLASYFKDYVLALEGAPPPSLCAPNVAGPQWLGSSSPAACSAAAWRLSLRSAAVAAVYAP